MLPRLALLFSSILWLVLPFPSASIADVRIHDPAQWVGNPSMTADQYGNLYVAVEDLTLQWFYVYRSSDNGATWQYMTGVVGGPSGFETASPSIACVEDTGGHVWLFVAYEAVNPGGSREVDVLRVDTWDVLNSDILFVETGIFMSDSIHPEICSDSPPFIGNGSVYVTYNRRGGIDPANQVMFSRGDNLGATWTTPQVLAYPVVETYQRPHITFGGPLGFPGDAFRVFVTYEEAHLVSGVFRNDVRVRVSRDYGNTWDPSILIASGDDDQYNARVAAAMPANTVVIVYTDNWQNSGDYDVRYAYSTNAGVNWTLNGWLAGTTEIEVTPNVDILWDRQFHCAYWKGSNIHTMWAEDTSPTSWSSPVVVNDMPTVSPAQPRAALAGIETLPEGEDEGVAWTDTRGGVLATYFDRIMSIPTDVAGLVESAPGPLRVDLGSPYPNPGSGNETVYFPARLSRGARISLELFDARGRRLARSEASSFEKAGDYVFPWRLAGIAPGIYYVRVITDSGPTATTRVVVLK